MTIADCLSKIKRAAAPYGRVAEMAAADSRYVDYSLKAVLSEFKNLVLSHFVGS